MNPCVLLVPCGFPCYDLVYGMTWKYVFSVFSSRLFISRSWPFLDDTMIALHLVVRVYFDITCLEPKNLCTQRIALGYLLYFLWLFQGHEILLIALTLARIYLDKELFWLEMVMETLIAYSMGAI